MDRVGQTGNAVPSAADESGAASVFGAQSQQQTSVYELLKGFAAGEDSFHGWYHGALRALEMKMPDYLAQAAHSIRELCDRLPGKIAGIPRFESPLPPVKALMQAFVKVKANGYEAGWVGKEIDQPLSDILIRLEDIHKKFNEPPRTARLGLALTAGDPYAKVISKEWHKARERVFKDIGSFFQNVAHHNHFPTDGEFRQRLALFESLLLNYLTPCTATQQNELLGIIAAGPNENSLKRIDELVLHKGANFVFFFEKLNSEEWLQPLEQRGYFRDMPRPETMDDGQVVYRPHVPLVALNRLAGTAPKAVIAILAKLEPPDNPLVEDQLLRCMAAIKDKSCIPALRPLAVELSRRPNRSIGIFVNELLKSWVGCGALDEAVAVAKAHLMATVSTYADSPGSDTWMLREINRGVFERLSSAFPLDMARMLFDALRTWMKQQRAREKSEVVKEFAAAFGADLAEEQDDYGYWLEDFRQVPDGYRDLEITLATRLFAAGESVYRLNDRPKIAELDKVLRSNASIIFNRLRWQLYANFPEHSLTEARRDVLERISQLSRADRTHNYEFAQLLLVHAKVHGDRFLSTDEVAKFFDVVFTGPVDVGGDPMDAEYQRRFRREQLQPIHGLLQGERLAAYEALALGSKEIELDNYKRFQSGGGAFEIVPVAPKEAERLASMPLQEMWSLMNGWRPKEDWTKYETHVEEDYDQLALRFAQIVEEQPKRFLATDKWWENLKRPAALHTLLERAVSRLEKKPNSEGNVLQPPVDEDWANWFGIAGWVTSQRPIVRRTEAEPITGIRSLDSDWTWSRITVARFLEAAIRAHPGMPGCYTGKVADLIRDLVEAEDPRLASRQAKGVDDWLSVAISSARGRGIEVLLGLALKQKTSAGEAEPWTLELLEKRLDAPKESPAVFALLGAKLRLLLHLFGSKLKEGRDRLFPPGQPEKLAAAVVAHFKYDSPMTRILESYPDLPTAALKVFETMLKQGELKREGRGDFGSQLGTHIAFYYWNAAFKNDTEGEATLDRFFAVAPKQTRAAVISTIGSIFQKETEHTPKLAPRVMRIWERRFAAISDAVKASRAPVQEFDEELAESTDWLRCECFPFSWRVDHAMKAIGLLPQAPRSHYLLESITELGKRPERLNGALQILSALLAKPSDELRWSIEPKNLTPILSLGLASNDGSTRALAEEARDRLLKLGFFDFLDTGK